MGVSLKMEVSLNQVGKVKKKEASEEAECERGRSDCVIALQRSFEKQHLRASVVQ